MDWSKVFLETLISSYSTISRIVLIFIPLIVLIECMKDMGWLNKIADRSHGFTRLLGLPGESAIGLIVGIFTGVVLSSGVIMEIQQEINMTKTQMNVLFLFIGICHGIIEETVVFTSIGVNGLVILASRLAVALVAAFLYIRITRTIARFSAGVETEAR